MNELIIGREKEITILESKLLSQSAEFTAVYGRRRVGKTYLKNNFSVNMPIFYLNRQVLIMVLCRSSLRFLHSRYQMLFIKVQEWLCLKIGWMHYNN
ncbi:hypothetical protein [Wolbachia pipientis]|uniref:hypothetical protein n=1 Tax=Wolbachia pipientis TaxID=955 RepID=UPI0025A3329A|nr:hypothetical protein [Wolbachia pipientis]MDM8335577.1 hypothetical protein [Wolbachia pipientis]